MLIWPISFHIMSEKKKHLELLILTLIRVYENTASSDHVSHCKSGKTFGGWGCAPDPEWGAQVWREKGGKGTVPPSSCRCLPQLPAAGDAAGPSVCRSPVLHFQSFRFKLYCLVTEAHVFAGQLT